MFKNLNILVWTLTPDQCVSSQTSTEKSLSAAGGSCHRAHSWSYTERKRLQNAPSCMGQLLHTAPFQAQRPKWKSDRKIKIQRQWMISRKECFLDTARQMPMQANRDCGCDSACKTPAGSSQMKSPHREWVVGTKSCPEPRSYWHLIAAARGKAIFSWHGIECIGHTPG